MRKFFMLGLVAAAVLAFGTGCSTFVGIGMHSPNDSDIADNLGGSWPMIEVGGVVEEEYKPMLIRGGIGYTMGSDSYSSLGDSYDLSLDYLIFRASVLYLFPNTSDMDDSGLYAGGGLSYYNWTAELEITSGGITVSDDDSGSEVGLNFVGGYRYVLGPGQPAVYAELIYESIPSGSEDLDADIGGLQFLFGLNFY